MLLVVEPSADLLDAARALAADLGLPLHAAVIGDAPELTGVDVLHIVRHELLQDYGPEAWASALDQLVAQIDARVVLAAATERGNEVMAHLAAMRDLPLATNCISIARGWSITRERWGGSLLEDATVSSEVLLATFSPAALSGTTPNHDRSSRTGQTEIQEFAPELEPLVARTTVRDRVVRTAEVSLATAPVVVGGGRGVGSPEGFAVLEELAALLGGAVGCSRAVTNSGWRSHTDQVGQTGTRIAPTVYIACGISGAIQHWVGAMGSKTIIAVNTDPEANMVTKADYAVIGDLHEVVPAVAQEIIRRRSR